MAACRTGFAAGPLRYPVPTPADRRRPDELRLRARLCGARAAEGAGGRARHGADPRRGALARLHRQDLRARAGRACRSTCRSAAERRTARNSTNGAARLPQPLATLGAFRSRRRQAARRDPAAGERRRSASPMCSRSPTASSIMTRRRRSGARGDWLVAELQRKARRPQQFRRRARARRWARARVPRGAGRRSRRRHAARRARLRARCCWAVLGAIAGGILLNLMPCVFPILALKALHLSRAGGEAREARVATRSPMPRARSSAPARLGAALLAIRAGGSRSRLGVPAAGPAHDHAAAAARGRDHRQPARPVRAAGAGRQGAAGGQLRDRRARRLRRDALRRAVPRRGAGDGAAAAAGGIGAVFAALGLGPGACRSC